MIEHIRKLRQWFRPAPVAAPAAPVAHGDALATLHKTVSVLKLLGYQIIQTPDGLALDPADTALTIPPEQAELALDLQNAIDDVMTEQRVKAELLHTALVGLAHSTLSRDARLTLQVDAMHLTEQLGWPTALLVAELAKQNISAALSSPLHTGQYL